MRPRVSIAAPLVVLVFVSSALGSTLDCGVHSDADEEVTSEQTEPTPQNAGYGKRIGLQEGGATSHDEDHHSRPTCCHGTPYAPLSRDGLDALRAMASARRLHGFITFVPSLLTSLSLVLGHGPGPPGPSFPSARLFPGRQLFLAVSSLLL